MVDFITENGLRLVFSTNTKAPHPDTFVFGKEAPPAECLGEPFVNEAARDMLSKDMKWLASDQGLLSLVMMTVSENDGKTRILTQSISGRATVVRHGQIEFNGNVGSIVIEKGGWLSGNKFYKKNNISGSGDTPWGLYGSKESIGDIKISNALIQSGFKSALSLGFIPLNSEKTRKWLLEKFKDDTTMQEIVDNSFSIVEENGDLPVLDFRVGGVEYRIKDWPNSYDFSENRDIQRGFLAHSARILKEEIIKYPKRYLPNFSKSENTNDYLSVLDKVGKRIPLNLDEQALHKEVYMAIGMSNAVSFKKFLDNRKSLDIGLPDILSYYFGDEKDICYAGFTYDYEQLKAGNYDADELLPDINIYSERYLNKWTELINNWYTSVIRNCVGE